MNDECIHGMPSEWCATCSGTDPSATSHGDNYGYYGGETKQDLLDQLCDTLGLPREPVGEGSSLPSHIFHAAANQAGVSLGSMPEIGEAIAVKAGVPWGPSCDSRGSISGGGSTVTADGMRAVIKALGHLA